MLRFQFKLALSLQVLMPIDLYFSWLKENGVTGRYNLYADDIRWIMY